MSRLVFFLQFMNWFSVRHLRTHPWRVFAVLFGIALGAAVFTSVRLAVEASLDAFTRSMDLVSGKAEWTVAATVGRVPEDLVATLIRHPAVETASPLITTYVSSPENDAEPFLLIGLDPILDHPLRQWEIHQASGDLGRIWLELVTRPYTLIMSRKLALKHGWSPGQRKKHGPRTAPPGAPPISSLPMPLYPTLMESAFSMMKKWPAALWALPG